MFVSKQLSKKISKKISKRFASNVAVERENAVARMVMSKKPVNSLSLEMLTDIKTTLQDLHKDKDVQGLIVASDVRYTTLIFSLSLSLKLELVDSR